MNSVSLTASQYDPEQNPTAQQPLAQAKTHDYGWLSAKTPLNSRHHYGKCTCAMERIRSTADKVSCINMLDSLLK